MALPPIPPAATGANAIEPAGVDLWLQAQTSWGDERFTVVYGFARGGVTEPIWIPNERLSPSWNWTGNRLLLTASAVDDQRLLDLTRDPPVVLDFNAALQSAAKWLTDDLFLLSTETGVEVRSAADLSVVATPFTGGENIREVRQTSVDGVWLLHVELGASDSFWVADTRGGALDFQEFLVPSTGATSVGLQTLGFASDTSIGYLAYSFQDEALIDWSVPEVVLDDVFAADAVTEVVINSQGTFVASLTSDVISIKNLVTGEEEEVSDMGVGYELFANPQHDDNVANYYDLTAERRVLGVLEFTSDTYSMTLLSDPADEVTGLGYSADGEYFYAVSRDERALIWYARSAAGQWSEHKRWVPEYGATIDVAAFPRDSGAMVFVRESREARRSFIVGPELEASGLPANFPLQNSSWPVWLPDGSGVLESVDLNDAWTYFVPVVGGVPRPAVHLSGYDWISAWRGSWEAKRPSRRGAYEVP